MTVKQNIIVHCVVGNGMKMSVVVVVNIIVVKLNRITCANPINTRGIQIKENIVDVDTAAYEALTLLS